MTVSEYARLTNQDVSGVYKKIKSGKLNISDFKIKDTLSFQHTCFECGNDFESKSTQSKYCSSLCEERAHNKKYKDEDWYVCKQKRAKAKANVKKRMQRFTEYQNKKIRKCIVCATEYECQRTEQKKICCSDECLQLRRREICNQETLLLSDRYVKNRIVTTTRKGKCVRLASTTVVPDVMVDLKRTQIKIKRIIYGSKRQISARAQ